MVSLDRMPLLKGRMAIVANAVIFQAGWFAAVILHNPVAVLILMAALLAHYTMISRSSYEWMIIFVVGMLGFIHDAILTSLGWMSFANQLPPLWLLLLWWLFATTLLHSAKSLLNRPLPLCVLAAIAGPLNYLAGSKFGAVTLEYPMPWFLSLSWPLAFYFLHRFFRGKEI